MHEAFLPHEPRRIAQPKDDVARKSAQALRSENVRSGIRDVLFSAEGR
jgi:hypothetical protein